MQEQLAIGVFGLGYVGTVSAGCLAHLGHAVAGIDVNPEKVDALQAGHSPVVEPGLEELIREGVSSGRLTATCQAERVVEASEVILICVGTPNNPNGSLNTEFVKVVSQQIGCGLRSHPGYPVVVYRSTILPGKIEEELIALLEQASEKRADVDFGVAANPEFLRQGSAIKDFVEPPFTVIGTREERSADILRRLYAGIPGPCVSTDLATAAAIKYACNAFHAVKITFANEIGNFCKAHGIGSHRVMEVLCQDRRLNISPAYLRPGYAFGGSCLPKDLSALLYQARRLDLDLPLLEGTRRSNDQQVVRAIDMIRQLGRRRVGLLGLSFKAATDDLRGSPLVLLAEGLLAKGFELKIYDPDVVLGKLVGTNKRFIESVLPHLSLLVADGIEDVIEHAETLVIGKRLARFSHALKLVKPGTFLIDLVGLADDEIPPNGHYQGICW